KRNFSEEKFKLEFVDKLGEEREIFLPREEIFGLTHFLEYEPPSWIKNKKRKGVSVVAVSTISFGRDVKEIADKYSIKTFRYSQTCHKMDFEKMIMKIAYCFAVSMFGVDAFNEVYVLPALLDDKDDIGTWFGGVL